MTQRKHTRIGVIAVIATLALVAVGSGGAAAADPADVDIVFVENATDAAASGPLPDDRPTYGFVAVRNTSTGGTISPSEVTIDAGGVSVTKADPFPPIVEGLINASDIPDGGVTVDVLVNGTTIGSETIYVQAYDTDTATVNESTIETASNITVTVDGSAAEASDYQTYAGPSGNLTVKIMAETSTTPAIPAVTISNETTATVTQTTLPSDIGQQYWDDATNVSEDPTTLYFSDAVTEIKIDGETVYDPGPLGGGGGGDGIGTQTLILVVVGAAAALILLND